jgi:hypothetical protein
MQDKRDGTLHAIARDLLAVDVKHAGAAAADTADVVEGERAQTAPLIFVVELERVLAWRESVRTFPTRALEIKKVQRNTDLFLST